MRGRQLPARLPRVFAEFQRARGGRGIDIIEMDEPLSHGVGLGQLHCNVVVLVAFQARAQGRDLERIGKPQLQPGVVAFQVEQVVIQHRRQGVETERRLRMAVKAAHDARHVDALLACLQADGATYGNLQRHLAAVAARKAQRQVEIGDPHMLQLAPRPPDQRGRAVLQIGHRGAIGSIGDEILRIVPGKGGVIPRLVGGFVQLRGVHVRASRQP